MTPEAYRPVSYLEWNAARRPHAPAVWDARDISFEELLAHVRSMQRWLAAHGVAAGDVVGVRLPNVWQYVALELAIPDLGAVILPLPLTLGEHEMRWVTERTKPRLVIGQQPSPAEGTQPGRAEADPDRIVEIAMSSGTTGMPKLASLSARRKQVTLEGFTSRLGVSENDRGRAVAVAGAPLAPEIAERWERSTGMAISSFYGSMDAGQLAVGSPSDPREKRWTTVGRPHDAAEWKILESGEICVRGDLVQERYWGERSGPYSDDGWAHMGDLGFVDGDGYLHVVGRVKDIIIRGGTNINPYEVE